LSTQTALSSLKSKLDTIPSGLDAPFQRNPSSTSIRSMSPNDAVSSSPIITASPPKPVNGNANSGHSVASVLTYNRSPPPASPSVAASTFSLPSDKKDDSMTGRRGSFDSTRGNWGNRIVLTTYPGQANVGTTSFDSH
jgi:hypothetical protein